MIKIWVTWMFVDILRTSRPGRGFWTLNWKIALNFKDKRTRSDFVNFKLSIWTQRSCSKTNSYQRNFWFGHSALIFVRSPNFGPQNFLSVILRTTAILSWIFSLQRQKSICFNLLPIRLYIPISKIFDAWLFLQIMLRQEHKLQKLVINLAYILFHIKLPKTMTFYSELKKYEFCDIENLKQ